MDLCLSFGFPWFVASKQDARMICHEEGGYPEGRCADGRACAANAQARLPELARSDGGTAGTQRDLGVASLFWTENSVSLGC